MTVDLRDRVELGSSDWLEITRNFLEQRVTTDTSFSLCEVYTHPPSHLGAVGGRLAWTARVDDGNVEVTFGEHTDVDLHVEAPYDTIGPLATAVYDTDTEQRQVQREHGLPPGFPQPIHVELEHFQELALRGETLNLSKAMWKYQSTASKT